MSGVLHLGQVCKIISRDIDNQNTMKQILLALQELESKYSMKVMEIADNLRRIEDKILFIEELLLKRNSAETELETKVDRMHRDMTRHVNSVILDVRQLKGEILASNSKKKSRCIITRMFCF